ncbi:MAG: 50S ribosomal protein L17 [Planctomycetota bacterium]|jgi:large subunit ribosomal protein L17
MAASLVEHGAIRTTEAKAKDLRRFIERLITIAKSGTLHARRRVLAELGDRDMFDSEGELLEQTVVQRLFDEIAPRYASRPGGYTRIIKVSDHRIGDAGRQVILQLVEQSPAAAEEGQQRASRRKRRAAKRREAAEETPAPEEESGAEEEAEGQEPADTPQEDSGA